MGLLKINNLTQGKRSASGGVMRADDPIDWTGGVYAIQTQMELSILPFKMSLASCSK
jgi:hypothetical protein